MYSWRMGGLLSLSGWIRPFGFIKNERDAESELMPEPDEMDLVTFAVLALLDIVTLPLAVFWLAGVGRNPDDRQ